MCSPLNLRRCWSWTQNLFLFLHIVWERNKIYETFQLPSPLQFNTGQCQYMSPIFPKYRSIFDTELWWRLSQIHTGPGPVGGAPGQRLLWLVFDQSKRDDKGDGGFDASCHCALTAIKESHRPVTAISDRGLSYYFSNSCHSAVTVIKTAIDWAKTEKDGDSCIDPGCHYALIAIRKAIAACQPIWPTKTVLGWQLLWLICENSQTNSST